VGGRLGQHGRAAQEHGEESAAMRTTEIKVTAEDYCTSDPILTAIYRHLPEGVDAAHYADGDGGEDITFYLAEGRTLSRGLPAEAVEASRRHEGSQFTPIPCPGPFAFELEVPDETDLKAAA
jgi:hypothetical protein